MKHQNANFWFERLRSVIATASVSAAQELWSHKVLVAIVLAATLLRTWSLNTHAIFFGDAARDLLVARDSLATRTLPLLGIPSSVPRFRQGPVAIWIEMLSLLVSHNSLLFTGMVFAFLSIAAVIGVYELLAVSTSPRVGLFAAFFLAFSPLAIAHARVVYHIVPIPFVLTLYFFALLQLAKKTPRSLFIAVLSFCFLFQFELALTPLVLLIPYVLWRTKQWRKLKLLQVLKNIVPAIVIGLLPQLIYDVTHRFAQLGGFAIWIVYRVVAFGGYKHDHTFSLHLLTGTGHLFQTWFFRIWSADNLLVSLGCLTLLMYMTVRVVSRQKKSVPLIIELVLLATGLLLIADIIHGAPGEAYFPPFFVLSAILLGYACEDLLKRFSQLKILIPIMLIVYASINTVQIVRRNFFVSTHYAFAYGPSIQEQREVMTQVLLLSHNNFRLTTTDPAGHFVTYFDNLRWVAGERGVTENQHSGKVFFIESKTSPLRTYPNITRFVFPTIDVYSN